MSVVSIMAAILEDELLAYGVLGLTRVDCEAILRSLIARTAELGIHSWRGGLEPYPGDRE
jgi:hypothetical protein